MAQQRERENVAQDELDRIAQELRKAKEDNWVRKLQDLKNYLAADKRITRDIHTHN